MKDLPADDDYRVDRQERQDEIIRIESTRLSSRCGCGAGFLPIHFREKEGHIRFIPDHLLSAERAEYLVVKFLFLIIANPLAAFKTDACCVDVRLAYACGHDCLWQKLAVDVGANLAIRSSCQITFTFGTYAIAAFKACAYGVDIGVVNAFHDFVFGLYPIVHSCSN